MILAELWMTSKDRDAIAVATDEIDKRLAADASHQGVDVRDGLRALFAPPLRVLFNVREDDRVVEVVRVLRA